MDILLFIYFLALEKHLNFSVAADELYLSQSSLSKKIRGLEKELGVELFQRNTRTIELTAAGKAFLPYAKNIVDEYLRLQEAMDYLAQKGRKKLTISTISFMSQYDITRMLASFKDQNEGINLEILEQNSNMCFQLLEAGQADASIILSEPVLLGQYDKYPLIKDRLVLLVYDNHALANRASVYLREIKNEILQLIPYNHEPFLYEFVLGECRNAGFEPCISPYGVWLSSIEMMMQNDGCVSLLPSKIAEYLHNSRLRLIRIEDTKDIFLSIVTSKEHSSPSFTNFIQFAMNYVSKHA
ncbi:LysR family transcriptional regulator [Petroclostridium sp. X23]|uniref:LysR family transcriptional regulator n=1 Tax=Petroclostridium sp. X23 TaxID=3045146 RepID=UPI0024AD4BEA|nr:LysR family transcriptional regulator [Petroclostridium sp. X23]WHH60628.1 LysR family transcriptional regulator [Petroclostridium sp. X23]